MTNPTPYLTTSGWHQEQSGKWSKSLGLVTLSAEAAVALQKKVLELVEKEQQEEPE